eukprot:287488-Pyramimonas_sp.AAC.1
MTTLPTHTACQPAHLATAAAATSIPPHLRMLKISDAKPVEEGVTSDTQLSGQLMNLLGALEPIHQLDEKRWI